MTTHLRRTLNDQIDLFHRASRIRDPLLNLMSVLASEPAASRYVAPLAVGIIMADELGRDIHYDINKFKGMLKVTDDAFHQHVGAMRDMVRNEMLPRGGA